MKSFEPKSLCILGRQPALGAAELESLYGAEHIRRLSGAALLDIPAEDIDFTHLGGTIKVARILSRLPDTGWPELAGYLIDKIPQHLTHLPDGKFTLGLSVYGLEVPLKQIERTMLEVKKTVRVTGRPVRIVPNKAPSLNSATVLHNRLTHQGAWELIFIKDGPGTWLAQTLFVQDITAYAARDQARPARDARVGMLPPKLAQIIVNLATGPLQNNAKDKSRIRVLDPFCGTGVILQEALLMSFSVYGTDIEPRMVKYASQNLQWLIDKYPKLEGNVTVEIADATSYRWPGFSAVASEIYLGRPLSFLPPGDKLQSIITDVNTITRKFLLNLAPQLKSGRSICLAVPAWRRPDGQFVHLPVLAKLTDMGYNYLDLQHVRRDELIYWREGQIVARQLIVLKKV